MAASGMGTERQVNGSHVSLSCGHLSGRARSLSPASSLDVVKPSNSDEMTLVLRHRCAHRWRRASSADADEDWDEAAGPFETRQALDWSEFKASASAAVVVE